MREQNNYSELSDTPPAREEAPSVRLLFGRITDLQGSLFDVEAHAIDKAVPKRKREFCAGRTLARAGLNLLGIAQPPVAIPVSADRAPVWPKGFTGSITHTDSHCACAVAPTSAIRSIGIDMEKIGAVGPALWDHLFTPSEQFTLNACNIEEQLFLATLYFCAKEAFFKLQYPLTAAWLDFTDATVSEATAGIIRLTVNKNTPAGRVIPHQQGYYQVPVPGTVLCQFRH